MKNGVSAPFVRVYFESLEITSQVDDFTYHYDEEDDDFCEIKIRTADRSAPDQKQFQEKTQLTILWGFIAEDISEVRKVYIQDVKWEYSSDGVQGILSCTEKAISLRFSDSKEVHSGSLLSMVSSIADKHGLNGYIQTNGKDAKTDNNEQPLYKSFTPRPEETTDQYLRRQHEQKTKERLDYDAAHKEETQIRLTKILKEHGEKYNTPEAVAYRKKYGYEKGEFGRGIQGADLGYDFGEINANFKQYVNVPQGNRTDRQFLNQMANREPNGPYYVDTRDDDIIIKKRNFNQKPYKTFKYGGNTGDLTSFTPETKNRQRKSSATNIGFGGWNAGDKSFFSGYANPGQDNDNETLAKFHDMLKFYKGIQGQGGGTTVTGRRKTPGWQYNPTLGNFKNTDPKNPKGNAITNTTRVQIYTPDPGIPITVDDKVKALEKTLKDFDNDKNDVGKNLYGPYASNPYDAFNNAANRRKKSDHDKNKANAKMPGDPKLKVGLIITILSVSTKFSGNYYITKATHTISKTAGYVTDLEMVRDGHNIKVNSDSMDSRTLGKNLNSSTGPEGNTATTKKIIGTKTNP